MKREARNAVGASLLTSALLFQTAPLGESVATYRADCATPASDFSLGETVCAKVTGAPAGGRAFNWADPAGFLEQATPITSGTQTDLFTLPATATSTVGGVTVNNRGTWRVGGISYADGAPRSAAYINVSDPDNKAVDLVVYNFDANAGNALTAGNDTSFILWATNNGPDAAQNVHVLQSAPTNMSFVSVTQQNGPAFNCTESGGTVDCRIAAFGKDAQAAFTVVYHVDVTTPNASISSSAEITSDTTELHSADNVAGARVKIAADPTQNPPNTCTLGCSPDITTTSDPGQGGANVNYSAPSAIGNACAPVNCDVPSGSFFPTGTTTVTCTGGDGTSCSFDVTVLDARLPVITLNGDEEMSVECHGTFTDPGATAADGSGNPLTVTSSGTVNPDVPDAYTITYSATDAAGHTATATRTVSVVDTVAPAITLNGDELVTVECHGTFTDPGATATDACAGGNVAVTVNGSVDTDTPGTYVLTYTASDGANAATKTRTVKVVDTAPPVITVAGGNPVTIECHGTFTDPGATATDGCAGSVPVNASGTVDTDTPGTYTITYTASDGTNTATATRTVNVVDTVAPVVTLNGASVMTVECHGAFTDPGATATDGCAGSVGVTTSGSVNTNAAGSYTLTYTAADPSGNTASVTRTVNVVDNTPPVITVLGQNPLTVECHTSFTDPGATAADACAGNLPVTTSGSVNVNTPGTYVLTYTASDGANTATATRTVKVVDTTPPVISCPANIVTTLPLNSTATSKPVSFSVTADDSCAGPAGVTTDHASGSSFPVGTTVVKVTATDSAGNTSSCSFTVTVLYNFTGFFSPLGNLPVLNTVNAGRAVPVKFSLSGSKGLNIFAAGFPASGVIACNASDPVVDVTETVTAGGSSLSYDASSDQYNYVWKTDAAWANSCRQLVVQLNDGSLHRANFKFK